MRFISVTTILLSIETDASDTSVQAESKFTLAKGERFHAINHEFCFSCLTYTELVAKDTLEEVQLYAQLKNDARAVLPSSFTVCSSSMTTYGRGLGFFTLLGEDGNKWMGMRLNVVGTATRFYHGKWSEVKMPQIFAHQWVSSCVSINSEKGLLQWVVDGTLVENATLDLLIRNAKNKPTNLSGRIVLGAWQFTASKKWAPFLSNQVTNLNIFSSALTIGEMQRNTMEGGCGRRGDYLAWENMQWVLKGQARVEFVDAKEVCSKHPSFNLYPAPYLSLESCKHFCGNFGARSPSLITQQQWTNLYNDLGALIYNNKEETFIWIALDDIKSNGEWVDYYDHKRINFSLPWAPGEPNGRDKENCAVLQTSIGGLHDASCEFQESNYGAFACLCDRTPKPYLRLRGLCSHSYVHDNIYQPMNNFTDLKRLTLVGLKTWIEYDNHGITWKLTDKESNVTAASRAPHNSFTIGEMSLLDPSNIELGQFRHFPNLTKTNTHTKTGITTLDIVNN